ncbi:GtrA family protein [Ramlibacter sp.]|uniref:GtrA family protein n=1 Tax=Ramlibacter sp. TaxID=1917967 RepID=UPI001807CAB3|nr:GtrA family protein [Ramlibacter sp.]MBA2672171.1 GtrA family protein [Ramlibacter sp.]
MKRVARIALLYAVVAVLATALNIAVQAFAMWLYRGPYAIPLSVLAGTAAGLPLKYVLEKRLIFSFRARDLAHDGRMFVLYSGFGVLTTALFWGTEYAFHVAFGTDLMRYVGATIGLTIGYIIKYQLDRNWVFVDKAVPAVHPEPERSPR